ncbi:conserved hypothetical protein [Streptomyces viridosporus ATCC 14672]|uniref:Uncharacterized protein n=1 Tax=Streptomyces viridosporus (strain ATCC 14672 / DSM 40746 / JCM 4963 / KCTC 9882 / NRRL B-12104 / FH 1290) TaxID=566461 RepID=D6A282_STRV1|nr:conserved hypothetical protein [Streptomyces viridosporus ATCC 14672]
MTEAAGSGIDDDHEWVEGLAWAYGLVSPDPAERAAALDRHARARMEVEAAYDRLHKGRLSRLWPARMRAYRRACGRCFPGALWSGSEYAYGEISTWPRLPLALLFLEWEARYPQEWTEHAKAWGAKQALIRDLAATDHDQYLRAKLVDLVDLAVQRTYRCKDREYVRVARAVDGDELRDRLHRAQRSENPAAQLHAGYVLWLLDRPEIPNTRHVWCTWLSGTLT